MEPKAKGKPPIYGQRMRRVCVSLDDFTIAEAKRIGGGNLAAGIRQAVNPRQVRGPGHEASPDALSPDTLPPQLPPP